MRKLGLSILALFMLLFVSACSQDNATNSNNDTSQLEAENEVNSNDENNEESGLVTNYPYTVVDVTGNEIVIEKEPERIVSTSTSDTEILFALGLGDKIYGVTDFDNYPEEALDKPKIGGVVEPNIEAILAQEPDLVVTGSSMSDDVAEKMRDLGLTIYQTDAKNMEEVLDVIIETGMITNRQVEAEKLVAEMREVVDSVKEKVAGLSEEEKKKVYIEYNPGWTVGEGEFMNELIEIAGATNVAADVAGWVQVNEEKIIQDDPDVIIYAADLVDSDSGKSLGQLIKERSGWDKITAIQEDNMVPIEMDIMSRNGPRIVVALKQMAEGIYPELFEQ